MTAHRKLMLYGVCMYLAGMIGGAGAYAHSWQLICAGFVGVAGLGFFSKYFVGGAS